MSVRQQADQDHLDDVTLSANRGVQLLTQRFDTAEILRVNV
jgi:hypothetical protein